MILRLEITSDMIARAKERLKKMPKCLRNSITGGKATLHGLVGEELLAEFLHAEVKDTRDYDLLKNGIRLEVKTKRTTVVPQGFHEASIAEFNTRQDCDYYLFTRMFKDFSGAWFLGVMPKYVYLHKARLLRAGTIDGSNGFLVKADCWNLRVDELLDCDENEFDMY